ncbi:MAG: SDR family oxidoreductase [Kiritimatiellia bacterium]|nr:SDR family oxidoreductase [Kiritimatiellia bacterium]
MKHANRKGTVLVTGGVRRLGKSIADALRADGWNVLVSSHRDVDGADIRADLSLPEGPARLYAEALAAAPDLCAIVNNAALFRGDDATMEALNLIAPRKLTILLAGREGAGLCSVVNILDSKVLGPASDHDTPYERTKRGLLADTRRFAAMFAQSLRVNAVAPGPILPPDGIHEPSGEMLLDARPTPQDVADAVSYLLSAKSVTGTVIPVDSGQHLVY